MKFSMLLVLAFVFDVNASTEFNYKKIEDIILSKDVTVVGDQVPLHGIIIGDVETGSVGDLFGIKKNDIITTFKGLDVPSMTLFNGWRDWNAGKLDIYRNGKQTGIIIPEGLLGIEMSEYNNVKTSYSPPLNDVETVVAFLFNQLVLENPKQANDFLLALPAKYKIRNKLKDDLNVLLKLRMCRHQEIPSQVLNENILKRPNLYVSGLMNSQQCWGLYADNRNLYSMYPQYENHSMDDNPDDIEFADTETNSEPFDLSAFSKKIPLTDLDQRDYGNLSKHDVVKLIKGQPVRITQPTASFSEYIFGPKVGGKDVLISARFKASKTDENVSEFADAVNIGFVGYYGKPSKNSLDKITISLSSNNYIILRSNGEPNAIVGTTSALDGKEEIELSLAISGQKWQMLLNGKIIGCGNAKVLDGMPLYPYLGVVGMTVDFNKVSIRVKDFTSKELR